MEPDDDPPDVNQELLDYFLGSGADQGEGDGDGELLPPLLIDMDDADEPELGGEDEGNDAEEETSDREDEPPRRRRRRDEPTPGFVEACKWNGMPAIIVFWLPSSLCSRR